ncbi:MAG: hypothetical protein ACRBBP_11640 [Bdellovibrionales bacterium]
MKHKHILTLEALNIYGKEFKKEPLSMDFEVKCFFACQATFKQVLGI